MSKPLKPEHEGSDLHADVPMPYEGPVNHTGDNVVPLTDDDRAKLPPLGDNEAPMPYPGIVGRTGDTVDEPDSEELNKLPSLSETVIPAPEHRDDKNNNTESNKRTRLLLGVGAIAAATGGLLYALSGGGDSNTPNTQTIDKSTQTTKGTTDEITLGDTLPEPAIIVPEGFEDRGNGFIVPEASPPEVTTLPEILETNDTGEVFKRIDAVLNYVVNSGDLSALKYAIGSEESEGAEYYKVLAESRSQIEERFGEPNFHYWLQHQINPEKSILDPDKRSSEVEVRFAELGFSDNSEQSLYEALWIRNMTLELKPVEVDGTIQQLWVMTYASEKSFLEINDFNSLLSAIETVSNRGY